MIIYREKPGSPQVCIFHARVMNDIDGEQQRVYDIIRRDDQ
jgi:hypothetical protein